MEVERLTAFEHSTSQLELTTLSSDDRFSIGFSIAFFDSTFRFFAANRVPEFEGATRRFLPAELLTGVTGDGVLHGLNGRHAATIRTRTYQQKLATVFELEPHKYEREALN